MKRLRNHYLGLLMLTLIIGLVPWVLVESASATEMTVFGPQKYVRETGAPQEITSTFKSQQGVATLELNNGAIDGKNRITSASISLNGTQILGPDDFKKKVFNLKVPIDLVENNTLTVMLSSAPGSYLHLRVVQEADVSEPFHEGVPGFNRPDAAVVGLDVTPDRCSPGQSVTFKATVSNIDAGVSDPGEIHFLVDDNEVGRVPVPSMQAGANQDFSVSWTAGLPGRHQVKAELVLPSNSIDACALNDSEFSVVRVSGESNPSPEIEFPKLEFNPSPLVAGQPNTLTCYLRNPGFVDLKNLSINFSVDDQVVSGPSVISSLSGGSETSVQFLWPNPSPGIHIIRAKASLPSSNMPPLLQTVFGWTVIVTDGSSPTVLSKAASLAGAAPSQTTPGHWSSMGPSIVIIDPPSNGQMSSLAFDPSHHTVYAGSYYGGVWKSIDLGATWEPVGDRLPHNKISALAYDPASPGLLFCAGVSDWHKEAGTIFRSSDGGKTWSIFYEGIGTQVDKIALINDSGNLLIYAATEKGIMRWFGDQNTTKSNPQDWVTILPGFIDDMAVISNNDIIASIRVPGAGTQLWQTSKAYSATGQSDWEQLHIIPKNIPWSTAGAESSAKGLKVDFCFYHPQIIYSALGYADGSVSIFRSEDGGSTWTFELSRGSETRYTPFIRVNPVNPDILKSDGQAVLGHYFKRLS